MARPLKQGLDYFPLDVDFLQDLKVRKIVKAQGAKSIPVLICLLANIYREGGYYLRWDGDTPFLIAEESGAEEGVVTAVLSKAQQVDFFDAEIFETYRVLTSRGIQKRYFLIIKSAKRKEIAVVENFLLIDPLEVPKNAVWYNAITAPKNGNSELKIVSSGRNSINSGRNSINSGNNPQREREREKERERERERERESRVKEQTPINSSTTFPSPALEIYQREIRPICSEIEQNRLTDDIERYGEETVIKAIERAVIRGKRSLGYIEGILKRWEQDGYDGEGVRRTSVNPQIDIARQAIELLRGETYGA